jgi:hypothetical protein
MRNNFSILVGFLFIFSSCVHLENDLISEETSTPIETRSFENDSLHVVGIVEELPSQEVVPEQEIIIKYSPNVTEEEKAAIRSKYGIVSVKTCDCALGKAQYELWVMEAHIRIEHTSKLIKEEDEEEVELVVHNKGFGTPVIGTLTSGEGTWDEYYGGSSRFSSNFLDKIVDSNIGVTVAILDTGIDPSFPVFSQPFLHNSSQNGPCDNEISGWNFSYSNNYPLDDDRHKHGTIIAHVIHNELKQRGVTHQILPVKTADAQGFSNYFTTLCGLLYAIEREAEVINLSFGWKTSDPMVYSLFHDVIDTTNAIIVCSAGNDNLDNDIFPHYPSNLPYDHVLSVAAAKANFSNAAGYSNYGQTTVDFYARGNKIYFPLGGGTNMISHYGTSFATPHVAAKVAELIFNGHTDIRTDLVQQFGEEVGFQKPVYYMNVIH